MQKIKILRDKISELNPNTITVQDIEDVICEFGLVHDKGCDYGEFQKYMLDKVIDLGVYQTPRQFAECIYDVLQLNIITYLEIGIFNGGSYLLMTEFLKLKNLRKSIGVDVTSRFMLPQVRPELHDFRIGTSKDFEGKVFDLVFIDGDHTMKGISSDWENVGKYAKYVMVHDINQPTWPDVKVFWDKIKVGKTYKEYLYQTDNKPVHGIGLLQN